MLNQHDLRTCQLGGRQSEEMQEKYKLLKYKVGAT